MFKKLAGWHPMQKSYPRFLFHGGIATYDTWRIVPAGTVGTVGSSSMSRNVELFFSTSSNLKLKLERFFSSSTGIGWNLELFFSSSSKLELSRNGLTVPVPTVFSYRNC